MSKTGSLPDCMPGGCIAAHRDVATTSAAATDCLRLAPLANMTLHHLKLGGRPALVIDDVYADPWALRRLALAQPFSERAGNYPGRFARVPLVPVALLALLNSLLAERLGSALLFTPPYHQLTLAATLTAPDALLPLQRQPHFDSFCDYAGLVHLSPGIPGQPETAAACVGSAAAGSAGSGTGFWRQRRTGWHRAPRQRGTVDAAEALQISHVMLEGLLDPAAGYPVHTNWLWELIAMVPRRFNRLLVYDARAFHSPHLPQFVAPSTLADARLTQNLFLNLATPATTAV